MADGWQELAVTVPDNLREAYISEEALRLIDLAITKLEAQHLVLRLFRVGEADGYVEPEPVGVFPPTLLEDARRDIKRCSTLHGLAASVLPLCCVPMDLVPSEEMSQRFDGHSGDALRNADDALRRLRHGASFAKAAIDAIDLAAALPAGVPLQRAWLLTADQLHYSAISEVTQARSHVVEMQYALCMQFFEAWSILGPHVI